MYLIQYHWTTVLNEEHISTYKNVVIAIKNEKDWISLL